jgi:hypothetical protein
MAGLMSYENDTSDVEGGCMHEGHTGLRSLYGLSGSYVGARPFRALTMALQRRALVCVVEKGCDALCENGSLIGWQFCMLEIRYS